jgi:hypothetical protein
MVKRIPTDMIEDRVSGQKLSASLMDSMQQIKDIVTVSIKKYSNLVTNNDWTTAINQAIEDIRTIGKGRLYFPNGLYNYSIIDKTINDIEIFGSNAELKSSLLNTDEKTAFAIKGSNVYVHDLTFSSTHTFNVDTDTRNNFGNTVALGNYGGLTANNVRIENCVINGAWANGIQIASSSNVICRKNTLSGILSTGIYAMSLIDNIDLSDNILNSSRDDAIMVTCSNTLNPATNVKVLRNTIRNSSEKAIGTSGVKGCLIADNYIDTTYAGAIMIFTDSAYNLQYSKNVVIKGNTILNAGQNYGTGKKHTTVFSNAHGIYVTSPETDNIKIADNDIQNPALEGINVLQGSNIQVINNVIKNGGRTGIAVGYDGSADYLQVTNALVSNNRIDTVVANGVYFSHVSRVTVTHNFVKTYGSAGGASDRAYAFNTCKNTTVSENTWLNDNNAEQGVLSFGTNIDLLFFNNREYKNDNNSYLTGDMFFLGTRKIAYQVAIPTSGVWGVGDIAYNAIPTSGGYMGWTCITAGTANNTAWSATTAYTLGQLVNANSKVYQCTVAGTSGSTSPSHTSGIATDGTVTWQYINTLAVLKTFGLIS